MRGLAQILSKMGYFVSGSDIRPTSFENKDIIVYPNHRSEYIKGVDIIIHSNAIDSNNSEITAAKNNNIPILSRMTTLAQITSMKRNIIITGSHGKTTTSAMTAHIFKHAQLNPCYYIGSSWGEHKAHGCWDIGEHMVSEVCESNPQFLEITPHELLINNLDLDHLENFNHNFNSLKRHIHELAMKTTSKRVFINGDDPNLDHFKENGHLKHIRFGFGPNCDIQAYNEKTTSKISSCRVHDKTTGEHLVLETNMPGRHNLHNALGAWALARQHNIKPAVINEALRCFGQLDRRFNCQQVNFENHEVTWVDDFGHHPTEVAQNLKACHSTWPESSPIVIFQPHRYTRTKNLWNEFVTVLSQIPILIIYQIYPACELPINNINALRLCQAINEKGGRAENANNPRALKEKIRQHLQKSQLIVTQGAGDINLVFKKLLTPYSPNGH